MAENSRIDRKFWKGKKVFVTGHTGFKGSWLCLWLYSLGAEVTGYAFAPPTKPSLYELAGVDQLVHCVQGDVRDNAALIQSVHNARPEILFHMAAQSLVRESYKDPVATYSTNVMGTVNFFEALRGCPEARSVVNVTTDKCYANREWFWGYRENEPMGGYDPYSNSKACSELITASYRDSFFSHKDYRKHHVAIASARSGNVIGGGDWAADRLVPDCIRSLLSGEPILIRNPGATRPWQHVLEPLSGYLLLAQKLYLEGPRFAEAWNFGPGDEDEKSVEWIVKKICSCWGDGASYQVAAGPHPHEANCLKLDCSKAKSELGWHPRWNLEHAIQKAIEWTRGYREREDIRKVCQAQIQEFENAATRHISGPPETR
jgi:CDP-glucose 4,6-dehydratase